MPYWVAVPSHKELLSPQPHQDGSAPPAETMCPGRKAIHTACSWSNPQASSLFKHNISSLAHFSYRQNSTCLTENDAKDWMWGHTLVIPVVRKSTQEGWELQLKTKTNLLKQNQTTTKSNQTNKRKIKNKQTNKADQGLGMELKGKCLSRVYKGLRPSPWTTTSKQEEEVIVSSNDVSHQWHAVGAWAPCLYYSEEAGTSVCSLRRVFLGGKT